MGFNLDLNQVMHTFNKSVDTLNIQNIVLDRWDLFGQLIRQSRFFERLTVTGPNKKRAVEELQSNIEGQINLSDLHQRETFDNVFDIMATEEFMRGIYSTPGPRRRFQLRLTEINRDPLL